MNARLNIFPKVFLQAKTDVIFLSEPAGVSLGNRLGGLATRGVELYLATQT